MCGRFVGFRRIEELQRYFNIDKAEAEVLPDYNVAPTHEILGVVKEEEGRVLKKFHWGLVPFWAKDISIGSRMINARSETVATKPSFRTAFKSRRCLILADGFYEWKGGKGGKQPVFVTLPDGSPFAFAGLWETWGNKEDPDSIYRSCTIITTDASDSIRDIHHRMPAILKSETHEAWIDPANQDADALQDILKTGIVSEFSNYEVSKQVNSIKNNHPANIERINLQ